MTGLRATDPTASSPPSPPRRGWRRACRRTGRLAASSAAIALTFAACAGDSAPDFAICPPESLGTVIGTYDYAEDTPGGPATADVALDELVAYAYPRLARAHFALTDSSEYFAAYAYTDRARGQMFVTFEKRGDSWGISTSEVCASLEDWARGNDR